MAELIDNAGGQSFNLDEHLGSGLDTNVYRSGDLALKVYKPNQDGYWASAQEVWVAEQIDQHPNIVKIYGNGEAELSTEDGVRPYTKMEYVDGRPIGEYNLSPLEVIAMGADLARAIQHVHDSGLVVRDISPANVIKKSDGSYVMIDLVGVTKAYIIGEESTRQDGRIFGTWNTCNQTDIILGHASLETDVYGLGTLMARALFKFGLVKERPDSDKLADLWAMAEKNEVLSDPTTKRILPVIERATETDPSRRYHSVAEMAHDMPLVVK